MTRLISILTILLLTSCSSNYDKREVTKYLKDVKELNQILISQKESLKWKNDLMTISTTIPQTRRLMKLLENKLNLTEIEFHDNIDREQNHFGLAYRFGNPSTDKKYSFLIFSQDDLESFRYYEQFSDCGESEILEGNWAFSKITVDCNN